VLLSIRPALNLISKSQRMNESYNPLHLVGSYGAFGNVTKERYEVVIEGTDDEGLTTRTRWREYEFKAKPGSVTRRPPVVAPYHLRLDWLMWFLPFSVTVTRSGVFVPGYEAWFVRFVERLLAGDAATLKLLRSNPFPERPPRYVRALFYRYRFTTAEEKRRSGAHWERQRVGEYLPPVTGSFAAAEEPSLAPA
jgi:hypothetical protein